MSPRAEGLLYAHGPVCPAHRATRVLELVVDQRAGQPRGGRRYGLSIPRLPLERARVVTELAVPRFRPRVVVRPAPPGAQQGSALSSGAARSPPVRPCSRLFGACSSFCPSFGRRPLSCGGHDWLEPPPAERRRVVLRQMSVFGSPSRVCDLWRAAPVRLAACPCATRWYRVD
jgi:hypothetical protein